MNSLVFAATWHLRRFQLPLITLLVFLQRTPVLRLLATPPSAWMSAPLGQTLRAGALVAASLGAVDTLAGATRFTGNPVSPASATVGTDFPAAFAVTGAPSVPKSYTVTNLAPGLIVPGATLSGGKYTLNGSTGTISGTPTTAGTYTSTITAWEFTNGTGKSTSYNYTIVVTGGATAPTVDTHPSSQTVTEGTSVTFSVSASGTAPLSYQWVKDNNPISGANSSSYTINSAGTGDAGNYWCDVTNSAGTATSNAASLTVNPLVIAPSFTGHPASQTVTEGGSVTFSYSATGTSPFGHQWYKDNSPISGANAATYTINPVQLAHAGTYRVDVGNSAGTVSSNNATLTVNAAVVAPSITSHPATQTVNVGTQVVFSVSASGTAPFSYQWYRNSSPLSGANSASYTIASAQTADAGSYTVSVGNTAGTANSNAATLTVNQLSQTITFAGPVDQGFSFTPLTLSATASSGLAPAFTLVSGPATLNGATLTLTGTGTVIVRADQAGNSTYAAASSVTRSFTVGGSFEYWQLQNFSAGEISAGTLTGPTVIVAADGLTNLVKYALGLPAKTAATSGQPVSGSASGNWTFTYVRPTGQTDVTVTVEAFSDLVSWSTANVTLTSVSNGNGTDTWTATRAQAGAATLFFRLKVTRP